MTSDNKRNPEYETGKNDRDEHYSPEQEAAMKAFAQDFFTDVKALAKQYIEHFFNGKMHHCGGKIPKSFLFAERRVSMVLNYDISTGVQCAYKALSPTLSDRDLEIAKLSGEMTSDIKLVTEVLGLLAKSGVPQQFAGGMMMMYLEFIEGVDVSADS